MRCERCDGCDKIANDEDGTPWTTWENIPENSRAAVIIGIIGPEPCPDCGGTGKREELER